MSWKRCWNGGYNHNFYEADFDEQIVPDIDRRQTSSSSSSLSSNSSTDASTSSARGNNDTTSYHHSSGHHVMTVAASAAAATLSPKSSHRAFPVKRDNNSPGNDGAGSASAAHYRVFGYKTAPSVFSSSSNNINNGHSSALQSAISSASNYSATSTSPWSSHKSPHNASDFFGSRNGEKRSGLELNDFWEEKYSRIAVITTTNHFGQTMSNKLWRITYQAHTCQLHTIFPLFYLLIQVLPVLPRYYTLYITCVTYNFSTGIYLFCFYSSMVCLANELKEYTHTHTFQFTVDNRRSAHIYLFYYLCNTLFNFLTLYLP